MKTYTVHITEWNKAKTSHTTREATIASSLNPQGVAGQIVGANSVRAGANVRFATVGFDPTINDFRISEFSFNVQDDGKADKVVTVR